VSGCARPDCEGHCTNCTNWEACEAEDRIQAFRTRIAELEGALERAKTALAKGVCFCCPSATICPNIAGECLTIPVKQALHGGKGSI
jgi:hypothetical protein